ncbi:MAG: hypothetical protein ACO4CS_16810 [bacterium]
MLTKEKVFTYHWRGYIGTFVYDEELGYYVCNYRDKYRKEFIFAEGKNRFDCLWQWMGCVNDMIAFGKEVGENVC